MHSPLLFGKFPRLKWKRQIGGGLLGFIGFMLSPLSWWNDLFVNVPLALAFAWVMALFVPKLFSVSFVIGYWLTNVLGFVLMHKGGNLVFGRGQPGFDRKRLAKDLIISLLYTGLILLLLHFGVLKPISQYLPKR